MLFRCFDLVMILVGNHTNKHTHAHIHTITITRKHTHTHSHTHTRRHTSIQTPFIKGEVNSWMSGLCVAVLSLHGLVLQPTYISLSAERLEKALEPMVSNAGFSEMYLEGEHQASINEQFI